MLETRTHIYFLGGVFSQWYAQEFDARINGVNYRFSTAEQYMMACKAKTFHDDESFLAIMATADPKEQKAIGQLVKNFNDEEWSKVREQIAYNGNLAKFSSTGKMENVLLETRNKILVEGSPTDKIWGVGLGYDDPKILDESNWCGLNLMGKAIMAVRATIRNSNAR